MQSTMALTMHFLQNQSVGSFSNSTMLDDVQIKKLLLTHDPDGRWLDSETMLHAVGNIMFHASTTQIFPSSHFNSISKNDISEIELLGCPEPVGCIISKISCQILSKCSDEGDLNSMTMGLFDLLGNYRWDAKVVLVLAAFAARYGEFWQLIQLHPYNALAASMSRLKQLPSNLSILKPRFKALCLLVKTMMDVAKCIIKFESLPLPDIELGNEMLPVTKLNIYFAVYWITRSILACFSQVTDLTTKKHEQVYSDSNIIAVWELSSLANKLTNICRILRGQVDKCHKEIERKLHDKLVNLFNEAQVDNQEVLRLLFPLKDYSPLKDCSTQAKVGVSELKNKTVIFLISKPPLLDQEESLLLVQQTSDHPLNDKLKDSYKIVWVPIPSSDEWTDAEETCFDYLSNTLPWLSVRKPWLLNSAVVGYIKEEWNYKEKPLMVVLDSNAKVINPNALDLINIWGLAAYPFSALKEAELSQFKNLTMQLLLDDIDPLLAHWVKKGKNLCVYGSGNLAWVRQLNARIKELEQVGLQLETIYVGNSELSERAKEMMAIAAKLNQRGTLSLAKLKLFWHRLESMRRSRLKLSKTASSDKVLAELSALLDKNDDEDEGWAVMGRGTSKDVIRLQGRQVMELLNKSPEKLAEENGIRNFIEPPLVEGPCDHSYVVKSTEGLTEGTVVCERCKRPMKNDW